MSSSNSGSRVIASMTRWCPLRSIRRPTESSVGRVSPSAARAAARSTGRNCVRSTPLRRTVTLSSGAPSATSSFLSAALTAIRAADPGDRPADQRTRQHVSRNQIDVGAARRDDGGKPQRPTEPDGGDAVRIDIVRIDCVKTLTRGQQAAQRRQRGAVEQVRRHRHADPGNHRIPRVMHRDAVAQFDRRHARMARPVAEARRSAREPRHGGDNGAAGLSAGDEMTQPVLHEYTVVRPHIVGVERREGQKPDRFHGRVGFLRDRRHTPRAVVRPPPASPGRWCDSRTATRSCSASNGRRSTRAPTSRLPTSPRRTEWFPSATPDDRWWCRSSRQHKVLRQRS